MKKYACLIMLMIAQISCADSDSLGREKRGHADTAKMMHKVSILTNEKRLAEREQRENQFSELVNTFFGEPQYLGVSPFTLSLYIYLHMLD